MQNFGCESFYYMSLGWLRGGSIYSEKFLFLIMVLIDLGCLYHISWDEISKNLNVKKSFGMIKMSENQNLKHIYYLTICYSLKMKSQLNQHKIWFFCKMGDSFNFFVLKTKQILLLWKFEQ